MFILSTNLRVEDCQNFIKLNGTIVVTLDIGLLYKIFKTHY